MTQEKGAVVLVTGGSGMVGRAVSRVYEASEKKDGEQWVFLGSKDGDLRDLSATRAIFEKYKPTHVLHLAAFVGGLYRNMKYNVEFWEYNMAMNTNITKCSHEFKVEKLVSCLSTCIFPDKTTYPINEKMVHNGPPHPSNGGYSYAKRMVDVMNHLYHGQYGSKFTSVVPTNVYGPCDNFHLDDSHVVPGMIHRMYINMKKGENFTAWGSGSPLRQFIYADDLAKLMIWTLRNYDSPAPIILSVDEKDEVSIKQLVEMIAGAMGFKGDIEWDKTKSDGQHKKTASNAKLRKMLPDFQFTRIEDGLKQTVAWFKENYEKGLARV